VAGQRDITPLEKEHVTSLYDGSLSYLDEHLGRLLSAIEADPEFEDTWVVITSDHGESLGEHRTLQHQCSLYQEILWTPLIVRYPVRAVGLLGDDVHPGAVDPRLVQSMDVLPTLLEGSGLPVPPGLDGRPFHEGRKTAIAEYFVNEELAREVPEIGRREMKALVEAEWKLIETRRVSVGATRQFFNLQRDPTEWHDLAWAGPLDMERLAGTLAEWRATLEDTSASANPGRPQPTLTTEQRDVLRAVGYLK
jgi:arylsulfatase A-like enzyme